TDKNESGFSPSDFGDMPEGFEFPGDGEDFTPPDFENMPEGFTFPEGGPGGFGGFGGGNGANLNYTDDDLDSYSSIWESSVRNSSKKDQRRVVKALKSISEGNDIEKYMDVDNLLRYMAVHSFLVNQDSLSGNMAHNYYLYESGGKLNIIPWDYNLSFGGMGMNRSGNGATSTINDAIDTPFAGTKFFDALLENEEYLEKYHEYYRQLVDEYVNGGVFDETYNRIVSQISDKVKDDPTAFYEYDEFEEAHKMLYDVVKLRAESVSGQLDGTIPSTDDGQKESDALIDASDIDLSVMGQMMGGGPKGDDESGEKRGMRPGGMAPRMSAAEEEKTVSFNWISLIICGAAVLAGLIFAGTFKRRKNNKHKQHKNHLTA
ncbi:MAG: CotH kinase family protein, partial [Firmicutes bacterium]|nr:CotH kinase family protein [Bacillota bacterium]